MQKKSGVSLAGTINSSTGAITGTTTTVTSDGKIHTYNLSGSKAASFTKAMLSGKTFVFIFTDNNGKTPTTMTYNADGTITSPMIQSGTWSINASGQLVYTVVVYYAETGVATLTNVAETGFTANVTWKSVKGDSGANTQTFTLM